MRCIRFSRVVGAVRNVSCCCSVATDTRATCSVLPPPSPLFNAVPACANWKDSSKQITVGLVCTFQRSSSGAPDTFDGGNFSYGLLLGRAGDARNFGLTVDPEVVIRVRSPSRVECNPPRSISRCFVSTLPFSFRRRTSLT